MRNWQRAHGTIALFMKRHQNNWRITLDFKSQRQLQDNYPKWCNCHSYRVRGRTYTTFVPLSFNTMMKTGLFIVRGNSPEGSICIPSFWAPWSCNQSLDEEWNQRLPTSLSSTLPTLRHVALSSSTSSLNFNPSTEAGFHSSPCAAVGSHLLFRQHTGVYSQSQSLLTPQLSWLRR